MADEVSIDKNIFHNRLSGLISQWKADKRSGNPVFGDAGSIAIVMGKTDESAGFHKANALQFWLLGYEFPATLFVITLEGMYIITTKKKAAYLEELKGGKTPVEIFVRGKDAAENQKQFERCLEIIKGAGKKVGVITKELSGGPFVQEWKAAFGEISKEVEEVDISPALSAAMSVKDENELRSVRNASHATSHVMTHYFVDQMSEILDKDKKISHRAFSEKISNKIDDDKFFRGMKDLDSHQLDWSISPTVMSGGNYDLKLATDPDDNNLHPGVIIAALGLRYQTYASMVARTYLVDPNKSQESTYKLLLNVHDAVIKELKDGAPAKNAYLKAISVIKAKKPELVEKFVKNVGGGIGIEARDPAMTLNAKNSRTLKDGMTLTVTTGFSDVENPNPQDKKRDAKYAMMLSDTVRVNAAAVGTGEPFVFTKKALSDMESTSFFFNDDEEEEKKKPAKPKKDARVGAVAQSNIQKTRLRGQGGSTQNEVKENARREHQKELHEKKQKEGQELYAEDAGNLNGTVEKKFKRFESYKYDTQLPTKVKDLVILADPRNNSVILPIMGRPVPFHISTIKNASTTTEGNFCFLRLNFLSPGQGVGRKEDQPFEDPNAQFVRSLTFRSKDARHLTDVTEQITEMKKAATRKEQEKKDMEDVVEQDKLIEIRNRRPHRLDNIFMRPAMESKRIGGAVEIHQNGLRYHHLAGGQKIDILFSNVKHLFFQPCAGELIVILHVHLINPIIVGKKKTKDIQFLREASETQIDETGNRKRKHRYGDEEEFEAEQEEKRRRVQLDKEFRNFGEKIADAGKNENLSVDMPFRELGFNGVPARSSVTIQPTTDCLVQLTEPPFLVITLTDIEVVHLERVQFGLKNFDMVVIFKDFTRAPAHINTIPVESLDGVKDWLDSVDIPFSEGPLNLNWGTIMKTLVADPHAFFHEGGWSFLAADSDGESDEEEEESAFEMSEEDFASESESEDESNFDSEASAEASDDEVSDEEDGEDWDELEKKAARKDREGGLEDEERKPKVKSSGGKSGGKKR